jgi:hypothetical protein
MPFEAAKEVCSTFCWNIRYALVPVFGPEFPNLCLQPNADGYESFIISPSTIIHCREQTEVWRREARRDGLTEVPIQQQGANLQNVLDLSTSVSGMDQTRPSSAGSCHVFPSTQPTSSYEPRQIVQASQEKTFRSTNDSQSQQPESSSKRRAEQILANQTASAFVPANGQSPVRQVQTPDLLSTPFQSPDPCHHGRHGTQNSIPRSVPPPVLARVPLEYMTGYRTQPASPHTPNPSSIDHSPQTSTSMSSFARNLGNLSPNGRIVCCGHIECHSPCRASHFVPGIEDHAMNYSPPPCHQLCGQHKDTGTTKDNSQLTADVEAAQILRWLSVHSRQRVSPVRLYRFPPLGSAQLSNILTDEEQQRRQLPVPSKLREQIERDQQRKPAQTESNSSNYLSPFALHVPDAAQLHRPSTPQQQATEVTKTTRQPALPLKPTRSITFTLPSIKQVISENLTGISSRKRPAEDDKTSAQRPPSKRSRFKKTLSKPEIDKDETEDERTDETDIADEHSDEESEGSTPSGAMDRE